MKHEKVLQTREQERIKHVVEYFEKGCLCLITERIKLASAKGQEAINYYMEHCTCSRHPESETRDCWDRE